MDRWVMLGFGLKRWCWLVLALSGSLAEVSRADLVREEAEPQLRLDLPGHTGAVLSLAFTPDSSRLVSGGRDKLAIVWRLADADEALGGEDPLRQRNIVRRPQREQVLRWQVARGPRGAIQSLAVSPAGNPPVIAIGGYGAMGSTGEIVLVDARDGTWIKTLGGAVGDEIREGHRESVTSLEFTADGEWLVSGDLQGQIFAWQRSGGWKPVVIQRREDERLGVGAARALERFGLVRPVAVLGGRSVAFASLASDPDAQVPRWRIALTGPDDPRNVQTLPPLHDGVVTALAATADGRRLVSADLAGRIRVLDPRGKVEFEWAIPAAAVGAAQQVAESLAIGPDGLQMAVGVAGTQDGSQMPRLEVWDLGGREPRRVSTRSVAAPVRAVRVSPDGRWLAWSGGRRQAVMVEPMAAVARPEADAAGGAIALGGVAQVITRVAFSAPAADARLLERPADGRPAAARERNIVLRRQGGKAPRRLAVSRGQLDPGQIPPLDAAFDLEGLAVSPVGDEIDWWPSAGRSGEWTLERGGNPPEGVERWHLSRAGRPGGVIDLEIAWQGLAGAGGTARSWISRPDEDLPWAVAIGTDLGIAVYRLEEEAGRPCRLLRRFRGNENRVVSLAVSPDSRWLASGGGDGILMLWSLAEIDRNDLSTDRWGVVTEVRDGRAIVSRVSEAGPLAGRDVRPGDELVSIGWQESIAERPIDRLGGQPVREALEGTGQRQPWNTEFTFKVRRGGDQPREWEFNRRPAWENLAALHLAADREWSFWTPRGYYAASANGDRHFGWLVNRGIDRLPRFFQAHQFRRKLERPDVICRLLLAGSLDAALRAAAREIPDSTAIVLPDQIAQAPEPRILSPRPAERAAGGRLLVRAEVLTPVDLVGPPQVSVSGAAAGSAGRLVRDEPAADGRPRRREYEWSLDLPREDRHLIQVYAATPGGPSASHAVDIEANPDAPPSRTRDPRIHVLAAGVNLYSNAPAWRTRGLGFDDLVLARKDAETVHSALTKGTLDLFEPGFANLLADASATQAGWKASVARWTAEFGRGIEPDDLIVLFLAGHGLTNPAANGSYSFLCHDAELGDSEPDGDPIPTGVGTLGWADLAALADVPCRKVALVDTCHSGALSPAARGTALRDFQENSIVILAAAADDESSLENDDWGHGAFTKTLLDGLGGAADVRRARAGSSRLRGGLTTGEEAGESERDGIVTLDEIVEYVVEHVPKLTEQMQNPTISPEHLYPYVRPRLVRVRPEQAAPVAN